MVGTSPAPSVFLVFVYQKQFFKNFVTISLILPCFVKSHAEESFYNHPSWHLLQGLHNVLSASLSEKLCSVCLLFLYLLEPVLSCPHYTVWLVWPGMLAELSAQRETTLSTMCFFCGDTAEPVVQI